jgi:hypothetical protein
MNKMNDITIRAQFGVHSNGDYRNFCRAVLTRDMVAVGNKVDLVLHIIRGNHVVVATGRYSGGMVFWLAVDTTPIEAAYAWVHEAVADGWGVSYESIIQGVDGAGHQTIFFPIVAPHAQRIEPKVWHRLVTSFQAEALACEPQSMHPDEVLRSPKAILNAPGIFQPDLVLVIPNRPTDDQFVVAMFRDTGAGNFETAEAFYPGAHLKSWLDTADEYGFTRVGLVGIMDLILFVPPYWAAPIDSALDMFSEIVAITHRMVDDGVINHDGAVAKPNKPDNRIVIDARPVSTPLVFAYTLNGKPVYSTALALN